jgi:hypothetical protein
MRNAPVVGGIGALVAALAALAPTGHAFPVPRAAAPTAAEAPIDPEIQRLVKDLGADDYRTREKAGQQLAAKGEKALPDLRRCLTASTDPEVGRRLAVLVRKMDHDRLVAPKRVTLARKDRTIKEALDEISKQTGYRIDVSSGGPGGDSARQPFEFDGLPFWEAVDRVATAGGMTVYADYDDESIRVWSQDSVNPYLSYAGPFRFTATSINSNKNVQLSGVGRRTGIMRPQEYMNFQFQIHSEPKNPLLGVTQAEVLVATDETGASLIPPKGGDENMRMHRTMYYNPGYRGHNAYGNVSLVRGDKSATTIKQIKGKIGIILLAATVPEIVVSDPTKVKNKKFTGRSVEIDLDSVTEANGQYTLSLTVRRLSQPEDHNDMYSWSNNIWQKLELVDAAGNKYRSYGPNSMSNNGTGTVQMTIQYGANNRGPGPAPKLGPVVKLVYNEWQSVTHEVTFEFKNVPLP